MVDKRMKAAFLGALGLALAVSPVLLVFVPQRAAGTDELMKSLPAYTQYKCLICHTTQSPTPQLHRLNPFGEDFLANGKAWNRTLALLNSDGDRCSNGSEIGDRDGDGVFDDGEEARENSNPGNSADCTAPISQATWGIIKEIFNQEIRQDMGLDPDHDSSSYFP